MTSEAAIAPIGAALLLALIPLVLIGWNLVLLRRLPRRGSAMRVSVLIPARNEAHNIGAAIESVLESSHGDLELLVADDGSTDETAAIVRGYAGRDRRVRLLQPERHDPTLWGKPQVLAEIAELAGGDCLLFMDADVRLQPDAVGRIAAALERSGAAMLSGVPRQQLGGLGEKLVVPLIPFILLGFLPLAGMRRSRDARFGVACGQLLAVRRDAYAATGGHRRIADRIHDGMALARSFRQTGRTTDIADFSDLADCRMYRSTREVIAGFAKNAHEGLGSPRGIAPWTLLLIGGQCAWLALLPLAGSGPLPAAALGLAAAATYAARLLVDLRFRQLTRGTLLHPVGVLMLVMIQWYALARRLTGHPIAWKARVAHEEPTSPAPADPTPRKPGEALRLRSRTRRDGSSRQRRLLAR
ncbi:MAG: glycosyltransferase family 2 protein [Gammaproteobacteria bacterium]|nr:glycosyltransferase family 2 protein [Gammaproteobacteria bacterium]